jgi:hypothetical protein
LKDCLCFEPKNLKEVGVFRLASFESLKVELRHVCNDIESSQYKTKNVILIEKLSGKCEVSFPLKIDFFKEKGIRWSFNKRSY